MEKPTLSLTEAELRDAGASASYIAYYLQAKREGESTLSTNHAERVVYDGVEYSGGGFHESLWNDKPRYPHRPDNPYGADGTNQRLLEKAGVYELTA